MIDEKTFGKEESHIYLAKALNKEENTKYLNIISRTIQRYSSYIEDLKDTKHSNIYLSMIRDNFVKQISLRKYPKEIETNLLWIIETKYRNEIRN